LFVVSRRSSRSPALSLRRRCRRSPVVATAVFQRRSIARAQTRRASTRRSDAERFRRDPPPRRARVG
jgi:hypothetical protein